MGEMSLKVNYIDIIKNYIVLIFVYIPSLVVFLKIFKTRFENKILTVFTGVSIFVLMFLTARYTQNLIPFILTVFCIAFMGKLNRKANNNEVLKEKEKVFAEDYFLSGFSLRNFKIGTAFKYASFSYCIVVLVSIASYIVLNALKIEQTNQEVVNLLNDLPLNRFLLILPVPIVFAPVLEEFIFRWIFFKKVIGKRIGMYGGAIISSLIFAMIHFNVKAFIPILWIGLFNCYLIHKKGYWYSVFNHMLFNSISSLFLLIAKISSLYNII